MKKRNQLIVMTTVLLMPFLLLSACNSDRQQQQQRTTEIKPLATAINVNSTNSNSTKAKTAPPAPHNTNNDSTYTLVMLGDSLTAGLGLKPGEAFPVIAANDLNANATTAIDIRNAGVSGDTSANGLARFDWSVSSEADGVIIALGANDMLNGLDPAQTRQNLVAMIEKARRRKLDVYLAGMRASNNLGAQYAASFDQIYPHLAREHCLPLFPFLLQPLANKAGDAIDQKLIQSDGLHPTAAGAARIGHALGQWLEIEMQSPHIPCIAHTNIP